jgi:hypothetical protein
MKTYFALFAALLCAAAASVSQAQTLNWGSENFSSFTDSKGDVLLDNMFVFELGAFDPAFVPDATNTSSWLSNWRVFDSADYSQTNGTFGSTVEMLRDPVNPGVVTSNYSGASSINFSGLTAYLWIRNSNDPVEGSEWLLTRADNWTFPVEGSDCCGKGLVEWSVSDLDTGDVPIWGRQSELDVSSNPVYVSTGFGVYTSNTPSNLQTFTFVPEPSAPLLAVIAGIGLVVRRRRDIL